MASLDEIAGLVGMNRDDAISSFGRIRWDDYVRSNGFVTKEEVEVLTRNEQGGLDATLGDADETRRLVLVLQKVLDKIKSDRTVQQYALTRIDDILSGKSDQKLLPPRPEVLGAGELAQRALLFQDGRGGINTDLFLNVLYMAESDSYCKNAASMSLARLLVASAAPMDERFIVWLCDELSNPVQNEPMMNAAVGALTILLRRNEARPMFGAQPRNGIKYLTKLLKSQGTMSNAQLLYELTFCLWALSFCEEIRPAFLEDQTIEVLVEQVTAAPREKVVRVSLATLRNLCEGDTDDNVITTIIKCELPKTLANMRERQWADPDVADDVEAVYAVLMNNYRELSTFERWAKEVESKKLRWGSKLVHSEKFWRENAKELERNDFILLKALIMLLNSEDRECVQVACYDLGEFVRFYPNGKSIVKNLGAKDLVMLKIEDEDEDVQLQALQCMSKIMVNQWEFMS